MIKPWPRIQSEPIANLRIFSARWDVSVSPRTGQAHRFVVLESPDWINVVPLTPEGNVIFVRQYRHGNGEITLEVPGGLVEAGEDPAHTAEREMLEETGYRPEQVHLIGQVAPNPAFLNNTCYSYLALYAHYVREPQFDGGEDIERVERPLAQIPEMIRSGELTHSLTVNAFYFLHLFRCAHPDLFPFA